MWYCKMYFPGRHEVIESDSFGTQGAPSQRKVFPFLESLLSFTELDIGKVAVALRCISDDLESLDRERVTNAMVRLGALAEMHSFFRVLYAKWFYFRELVLDIDKAGREPSRQVLRYYHFDQPNQPSDPELFPFRLLTTRLEPVDGDTCAPVLYANTVADMISYSLQTCVERSITVRCCKNCGRYFAQTGRVSAEYCDRTPLDGQSSCRAMGAFQQWTLKQADDPVFKVYRREYKRRFAWIKAGRISDSEFYAWSEQAREQKKKCDEGIITAEQFQQWLKES